MSGIENILSRLQKECDELCAQIIAEAKEKAQSIIDYANTQVQNYADEKSAQADKESELIIQKAYSSAAAVERKQKLSAKVQLIETVLENSLIKLHSLDAPSYFQVLKKLAVNNLIEGKGIMYLSQRDLDRLPQDFLSEYPQIEISKESADIKDGFILKYGDIEMNCTFRAMLNASKDELKAVAGDVLFG